MGMEVSLHTLWTLGLYGGGWSALKSACFTPLETAFDMHWLEWEDNDAYLVKTWNLVIHFLSLSKHIADWNFLCTSAQEKKYEIMIYLNL
jgi:hypothetical protein